MKQIKLHIRPDGTVQAETQGVKGKACTDYIKIMEELLDAQTVDSSYTPEYYETEDNLLTPEIQSETTGEQILGLNTENQW